MKVVINVCHGGFSLSEAGEQAYLERKGGPVPKDFYNRDIDRQDPDLVAVVEELGPASFGLCAQLSVVEIPDDVKWHIAEYDGLEWVAEDHRTWYR